MLALPERVTVVEVGPRDGLQSLGRWIDTDIKVAMIDRLTDAGFPVIEITRAPSIARWCPTSAVRSAPSRPISTRYSA